MRFALHSILRPGAIEQYREHHARIPEELRRLFDRVGIDDWVIWRSGDRLFHIVECDSFETAMTAVAADPVNDRWQADIGRFVEAFFGPDGSSDFVPIEEVWSLQRQREDDGQ